MIAYICLLCKFISLWATEMDKYQCPSCKVVVQAVKYEVPSELKSQVQTH